MLTSRQRRNILSWSGAILLLSLLLPAFFHADLLTAGNLTDNGHFPRTVTSVPMHFETDPFGRVTAYTGGGSELQQSEIIITEDAYLYRIDIDNTFFYVSDQGMFSADTDTVAISIYHGLAV